MHNCWAGWGGRESGIVQRITIGEDSGTLVDREDVGEEKWPLFCVDESFGFFLRVVR